MQEHASPNEKNHIDKAVMAVQRTNIHMLEKVVCTITTLKLARMIVNCTNTFRAKKNWNSHGITIGSAICQPLSIISSLNNARFCELDPNFIELITCGVVLTSAKH